MKTVRFVSGVCLLIAGAATPALAQRHGSPRMGAGIGSPPRVAVGVSHGAAVRSPPGFGIGSLNGGGVPGGSFGSPPGFGIQPYRGPAVYSGRGFSSGGGFSKQCYSFGGCRPNCFRSGYRSWCSPIIWGGFSYPYFGGYYGGYGYGADYGYGVSPAYDSYFASLQEQNMLLRQQLAATQDPAQQDAANAPPPRVNVPPRNRKTVDQAAQDRKRNLQDRANQLTIAGVRLFNAGTYTKAAERFREAIRLVDDDPSPHFYLAQALFASRRYAEAAQAIKSGLKVNPDWLETDFDMRSIYGNEDDLLPQLAHLASQLQTNPLDRDAMFVLGYELFMTGQKEKARAILDQTARLEPDDTHIKPFFDYYAKQDPDDPRNPVEQAETLPPPSPAPPALKQADVARAPYTAVPGIKLPQ